MIRTLAVLKLKKRIADILVFAQHVADSMKGNPAFPSPPRALAELSGQVQAATRAHAAVLSRTAGAAAKRDAKLKQVRLTLETLRVYVQRVADALPREEAATVIVSAGLFVKGKIARKKQTLAAKAGRASGTVRLTSETAGKDAAYSWALKQRGRGMGRASSRSCRGRPLSFERERSTERGWTTGLLRSCSSSCEATKSDRFGAREESAPSLQVRASTPPFDSRSRCK